MPDCADPDRDARLDRILTATAKVRLAADAAIERKAPKSEPRGTAGVGDIALTAAALRCARGVLGWSTVTLARKAKVEYSALVRAQMTHAPAALAPDVAANVRRAFEAAGVTFDPDGQPCHPHGAAHRPDEPSSAD